MKKTKKGMSVDKKIAIGTGAAVIGAGAYYLLGPKAKEHQKKAKDLLAKIKKEAEREIKKAKDTFVASCAVKKVVKKIVKKQKDRLK